MIRVYVGAPTHTLKFVREYMGKRGIAFEERAQRFGMIGIWVDEPDVDQAKAVVHSCRNRRR